MAAVLKEPEGMVRREILRRFRSSGASPGKGESIETPSGSLSTDPLAHWRHMVAIRRTLTVPLGKP